jgi:hypothetical protein
VDAKFEVACVSVLAVYATFDVIFLILSKFKGIVFSRVALLLVNCDESQIYVFLVHQFVLVPLLCFSRYCPYLLTYILTYSIQQSPS